MARHAPSRPGILLLLTHPRVTYQNLFILYFLSFRRTNTTHKLLAHTHSDHSPLLFIFNWGHALSQIPTWRLQCSALEEAVYRETIREEIVKFFDINTDTTSNALIKWDTFKAYIRGICIKTSMGVRAALHAKLKAAESTLCQLEIATVTDSSVRGTLVQRRRDHADISAQLVRHNYRHNAILRHAEGDRARRLRQT